jgi:tetratricopeptide (TPR) repeat protein
VSEQSLYPDYIRRDEEDQILREVALVGEKGRGRAVLLYGSGGVGKTSLVRRLAAVNTDPATIWVDPVDIDDSEYWLLSNLEQHVADSLDPQEENRYFGPYREYLSRFPAYTRPRVGYETVMIHLERIKQVFADCYRAFIEDSHTEESRKTVVIVLDTVEVIRGMYLLQTLCQWMKSLPGTLFILAGRPSPESGEEDPIKQELEDPHRPLPVTPISLGAFTREAAERYLTSSGVASGLSAEEKKKLVHLTQGHPLWLAFTVDYLQTIGIPEEAATTGLSIIEAEVPFGGEATAAGKVLREDFIRRLVAPYHEADFWHEALRRLAVVRESINQPVWEQIMADRPLPGDVASMAEAWQRLLEIPWIRPRANRRYVTLHDAVAEELALRLIPMHDQDKQWRRELWKQAEGIYAQLSGDLEAVLSGELTRLDESLHSWSVKPRTGGRPSAEETRLIDRAAHLAAQRRELAQMKAVRLYYALLCDFSAGCQQFLDLLNQAMSDHQVLFQDLLAAEIQRFLPGGVHAHASGDVVGEVIDEFRAWLRSDAGREMYLEIGLSMADYLIRAEKPQQALSLLESLPKENTTAVQRYRLSNLRGNACMRIPTEFRHGWKHFDNALLEAIGMQSADRLRLIAKAHKELGFYYRNAGKWREADYAYQQARDAISTTLLAGCTDSDREEMASIQTNWAYVKGLTGQYRDGTNLAESAITVRQRLGNSHEEGISWSVCGEVYRYERRFQKAWEAYREAEQIFQRLRNWAWLGQVYQEQAICLFQAAQDGSDLVPNPVDQAKRLITVALDLCRDLAVRGYPSALNRAGRILGDDDVDVGLDYLEQGMAWGYILSDGWLWFANLIEHAELCYTAWVRTRQRDYLSRVLSHEDQIQQAMGDYDFPDLKGRWDLIRGHLQVNRWQETGDESALRDALELYKNGFVLIAQEYVGSSGTAAVADEFKTLHEVIERLPAEVKAEWQTELRRAWSAEKSGATMLLARLEELY